MLDTLATLAQPWAEIYRGSDLLQFMLHATHLGGIAVAGGTALSADRMALRLDRRPPAHREAFLVALATKHVRVVAALGVVIGSGILLLLTDVRTLLPSPVFWLKMLTLAALLWNGNLLRTAGHNLRTGATEPAAGWVRLKQYAKRSALLWIAVALLGTILTTVG